MKFNSKSIIFNGGCCVYFDVVIPPEILISNMTDKLWQSSIDEFNQKLDLRDSMMISVDEINLDVLMLESVENSKSWIDNGSVVLLTMVRKENFEKIKDTKFYLNGHLTFNGFCDRIVIDNIKYIAASGNFGLINDYR